MFQTFHNLISFFTAKPNADCDDGLEIANTIDIFTTSPSSNREPGYLFGLDIILIILLIIATILLILLILLIISFCVSTFRKGWHNKQISKISPQPQVKTLQCFMCGRAQSECLCRITKN